MPHTGFPGLCRTPNWKLSMLIHAGIANLRINVDFIEKKEIGHTRRSDYRVVFPPREYYFLDFDLLQL